AKITPISRHQHIKTTIRGYCLICRNSKGTQTANKSIIYRTILKLSKGVLKEVLPSSKEEIKGPKRIRGTETLWKCTEYTVPIYRPGRPCWDIAHRRLF